MPLFEYRCRDCGETMEKLQRTPEDKMVCSRCGKEAKRVVSTCAASVPGSSGGCSAPSGSGFS